MAENTYYTHDSGQPIAHSRGSSAAIRAEFDAIAAAFQKVADAIGSVESLGDFRKIYQGARATDPTQRYDGTRLEDGDLYFNTGAKVVKAFANGVWHAVPTSASAMLKDGGEFTGPIKGTSAEFSATVKAGGFQGDGSGLTGMKKEQIVNALGFTPVNKAGDNMTGTLGGTNINLSGTLTAAVVTQTSDERHKYKWKRVSAGLVDDLAVLTKAGSFTYKRKHGGFDSLGVSAQELERSLPEAVMELPDGTKTVNYGPAALVASVALAREVVRLRDDVAQLKASMTETMHSLKSLRKDIDKLTGKGKK